MARSKFLPAAFILVATAGVALSQSNSGGWRRVDDPPPAPAASPQANQGMGRTDAYGQPIPSGPQDPQALPPEGPPPQGPPPQGRLPQGRPPVAAPPRYNDRPADRSAYGLPPELTLHPGTYVIIRTNQ